MSACRTQKILQCAGDISSSIPPCLKNMLSCCSKIIVHFPLSGIRLHIRKANPKKSVQEGMQVLSAFDFRIYL